MDDGVVAMTSQARGEDRRKEDTDSGAPSELAPAPAPADRGPPAAGPLSGLDEPEWSEPLWLSRPSRKSFLRREEELRHSCTASLPASCRR